MSLMNRWVDQRRAVEGGAIDLSARPKFAHQSRTVKEAEVWRYSIIRELSSLIAQIQNAGLGEGRIRELNDEINRLLKTKVSWELQIKKLGGPDHSTRAVADGLELPDGQGYKYFGAARFLPGVRDLFEKAAKANVVPATSAVLSYEYFGFRDEEIVPDLVAQEEAAEVASIRAARERRERERDTLGRVLRVEDGAEEKATLEKALLEKKKKMLLALYQQDAGVQ